ncbi:putative immunity protein [Agromyces sp. H66]|uniref:putative immunity protein n=1 Tax=Agromyces sp. H66 TaxID=2529859 RepID=UPI0010AB0376|nr:hypothetical protein [Agromyces sp. H66]
MPILPDVRDPRLITIRRGGTLTDEDHRLIAEWSAQCAEHVLPLFEREDPHDPRPRQALEVARAWIRGEVPMKVAHRTAFVANAAARGRGDAARFAALSAGQAVAVAHVAAHDLGAAAYAIRAAEAAADPDDADAARRRERDWQRAQLPESLRAFVLEDQRARDDICWHVFRD